jgi:hypothetical protein
MPIRRPRPLRALAVQRRSEAADAADLAARGLASIEAEIAAVGEELIDLAAHDRTPSAATSRAALLEADALDRAARQERSRELATRLSRLESERGVARCELEATRAELAKAIRAVKIITT